MELPAEDRPSRSRAGAVLASAAAICVVAGAVSLDDAAASWQDVLDRAQVTQGLSAIPCNVPLVAGGWGTGAVVLLTAAALGFLAAATWTGTGEHGSRVWGLAASLATLVPIALLWLDAVIIGRSPSADCDGTGLSGAAGAAVNRAGWLFLAATIFCFLAAAALGATRTEQGAAYRTQRSSRLPLHPWQ